MTLNISGCPGTQPDTRRILTEVGVGHIENIHFGHIFAILAIFRPLWSHSEAPEEPKFLVKVPFDFQEEHGELYRSGK